MRLASLDQVLWADSGKDGEYLLRSACCDCAAWAINTGTGAVVNARTPNSCHETGEHERVGAAEPPAVPACRGA